MFKYSNVLPFSNVAIHFHQNLVYYFRLHYSPKVYFIAIRGPMHIALAKLSLLFFYLSDVSYFILKREI